MNLIVLTVILLSSDAFQSAFDDANAAYLKGDFEAAAAAYETLIAEGIEDADVFLNLGNAYFRLNRLGLAIVNYERALHLEPGLEDASENLALAVMRTRQKLAKHVPEPWAQNLLFWHFGLAHDTTRRCALLSWAAFWALLALRLWRPFPYWRATVAVVAVFAAAFALSSWYKAHPAALAVVVADDTPIRYGPSEAEEVIAMSAPNSSEKAEVRLYDGDRVTVESSAGKWLRVATVDGRRGWVPATALVLAGPPYARPENPQPTGANPGEGTS